MPNIIHKIEANASASDAYKKLTTLEGLNGWWTNDTSGDPKPSGVLHFRFGDKGAIDMKVLESEPNKRVVWQVLKGPGEWIGTTLSFELKQTGERTALLFQHRDWKEQSEGMFHCSTKWAVFMLSLKSLLETGKGAAFPNDVHITTQGD